MSTTIGLERVFDLAVPRSSLAWSSFRFAQIYHRKYSPQLTAFPTMLGMSPRYRARVLPCSFRMFRNKRSELPHFERAVMSTDEEAYQRLLIQYGGKAIPCKRVLTISKGCTTKVATTPALNPAVVSTTDGEIASAELRPSIAGKTLGIVFNYGVSLIRHHEVN